MSTTEIASLFNAPGSLVRDFLDAADDDVGGCWEASELRAVFTHQWLAPLAVDLGDYGSALGASVSAGDGPRLRSFADLMLHERPPLVLLNLTKEFAKRNLYSTRSAIPTDIARVLYLVSIAAALRCYRKRISTLGVGALCEGLRWALAREWVHEDATQVLREGLDALLEMNR